MFFSAIKSVWSSVRQSCCWRAPGLRRRSGLAVPEGLGDVLHRRSERVHVKRFSKTPAEPHDLFEPIPGKRLLRAPPRHPGQDIRDPPERFRATAPVVTIPKPADVYRVLLLGDDMVFGSEVYTDELVSARLEQILKSTSPRRIEVLNAAIPGGCLRPGPRCWVRRAPPLLRA